MAIPIRASKNETRKPISKTNRKTSDPRLWLGIFFILAAMIIGQIVIGKASARVSALTMNSNIAKGSLIQEGDISPVQVSVPITENLITLPSDVVGKVAAADLYIGDLVSVHAVSNEYQSTTRSVSVPIRAGHLPQVSPGEKVDVWMTPSLDGVELPGPARLIIPNAVIAQAPELIDAGMDSSVTILIAQDEVQSLVQAMRDGLIDIVAIPVPGNSL